MPELLLAIILAIALPLVGIGIILFARRSKIMPNLALSLTVSGITGAIFAAFIAIMLSSGPIAPYETARSGWNPIIWPCLLGLYVGFGIGVGISSIVVSPILLIKALKRRQLSEKRTDIS